MEEWVEQLRVASGGRLVIALNPVDALVPTFELLEAGEKGTVDSYHSFAGYWSSVEPCLAGVANYPGGFSGEDLNTFLYQTGFIDRLRQEVSVPHNLRLVGYWGQGVEPIHSTISMRTLEDVDGTKARMGSLLFAEMVKEMGGATVSVPAPETYTSLATGVVDWVDASDIATNWDLGLHEVCPFVIFPGWHQATSNGEMVVNLDKWNELPSDLQTLYTMSVRALAEEMRERADWRCALTMERLVDYGTEIITWTPEEVEKVDVLRRRLEAEVWSKRSPLFAEMIDGYNTFWSSYGPYKNSVQTKR
jgi:TRAP-type mannitol/chloroaromatic compound transport system substrate-binding protein